MPIKSIPEGFHTVTPYLSISNAAEAIAFYKKAFAASEVFRLPTPSGEIGHAEILIGNSHLMIADPCDESPTSSPDELKASTVSIHLYVEDVDAFFARAIAAGATELRPVADQFYGDRMGTLKDPFGHIWSIGTHIEDLTPEEIAQRAAELFSEE